jgi:hypothetical protein
VPGITEDPQVAFVGDERGRGSIHVLVAIQLGKKPVVVVITPSMYPTCPTLKKYPTMAKNPTDCVALGAYEYIDALEVVFRELQGSHATGAAGANPHCTRSQPCILWHDHGTPHKAGPTDQWLEEHNIKAVMLPARSCDLDPLDYGVFGAAKRRMNKLRWGGTHMQWGDLCEAFLADLWGLDVDRVIEALPERLEACIKAGGGHIEQALKELRGADPREA